MLVAVIQTYRACAPGSVYRLAKSLQHKAAYRQADVALSITTVDVRLDLTLRQCRASALDNELMGLIAHIAPILYESSQRDRRTGLTAIGMIFKNARAFLVRSKKISRQPPSAALSRVRFAANKAGRGQPRPPIEAPTSPPIRT
jgi:hypothetical protein